MKLYTVIPVRRSSGEKLPPRYDLAPMNHAAACNFMDACRNEATDYEVHEWPPDVPAHPVPCFGMAYRRDGKPIPFAEACECKDTLERASVDLFRELGVLWPELDRPNAAPDHVRALPEWCETIGHFDSATRALGQFNNAFLKIYWKEWREEDRRRRAAKAAAAQDNPAPVSPGS